MEEFAQILQSRTALYHLLQGLYTYPLSRDKVEPLLELVSGDKRLEEGISLLRNVLKVVREWEGFLEQLNIEYTRLFEGPGRPPVPPYASFYLNDGLLMGPEALAVRQIYLEWKVAPIQIGHVPDDHIALELGFMGHLSGETVAALNQRDDIQWQTLLKAQMHFLNEHILAWVPHFCNQIASATPNEFFQGLSKLTQTFVEIDCLWIQGKEEE
ncbi:MAG: molecular chaperone TorD family protein [bacterium]|nr:molecular chaperone TorD family protein [bacterium]